jgi:hypothetical protein
MTAEERQSKPRIRKRAFSPTHADARPLSRDLDFDVSEPLFYTPGGLRSTAVAGLQNQVLRAGQQRRFVGAAQNRNCEFKECQLPNAGMPKSSGSGSGKDPKIDVTSQ